MKLMSFAALIWTSTLLAGCTLAPSRTLAQAVTPPVPEPPKASAANVCKGTKTQVPQFQHVVIVVEENQSFKDVIGNPLMPTLNELASRGALARGYYADTHPSINNYFFLTAGRKGTKPPFVGLAADKFHGTVGGDNIASVLTHNGKTWKVYAEDLKQPGYVGDDEGPGELYAKRHVPFAYFTSVRNSASQRQNIVPFTQFAEDQKSGLPNYSFVVPNLLNDGHDKITDPNANPPTHKGADCGDRDSLPRADTWLKTNIKPLVDSESFQHDGLLVIVFDEACDKGDGKDDSLSPTVKSGGGGHITGVLVGAHLPPGGCVPDAVFNHESILRLSLTALGVKKFPGGAATAPDLGAFFSQ